MTDALSFASRTLGFLYGLAIGDALAMPVHRYNDRSALYADDGLVDCFLARSNSIPRRSIRRLALALESS